MPQIYRLANVPRSITWDEVRRLLEAVDRRTIRGRRDYAILLLLLNLAQYSDNLGRVAVSYQA